ncbi:hypothetical protein RA178_06230 [Shewanella oncorhynchi]|uniref:CapR homology domain-containing protein n=1 Tax=Shewanella oncorhynchi TaxID=2726434 RepID=A0AA50KFZ6_9GAMM|nr:hypothetical protein [Shewanella oncorhynchi]WMB74209.1 hypothetical protein RA178_06230 [Shewanella oncorhynchi]
MDLKDFGEYTKVEKEDYEGYKFIGFTRRPQTRTLQYIVYCETCSKDSEMFGEGYFNTTLGNLQNGYKPCGCSKAPRWTEEQYKVLVKRVCEENGLTFNGWAEPYKKKTTKCSVTCNKHNLLWETATIDSFLNKKITNCPSCHRESVGNHSRADIHKKVEEVVKATKDMNFDLLGFAEHIRKDKTDRTKLIASCPIHGTWEASMSNLIGGRGCPNCKQNGYDKNKAGHFYIVEWTDGNQTFLKFGVTNRDRVEQRVYTQSTKTRFKPTLVTSSRFNNGEYPLLLEKFAFETFDTCVVAKEDFPDGYTETINVSTKSINTLTNKIREYLKLDAQ